MLHSKGIQFTVLTRHPFDIGIQIFKELRDLSIREQWRAMSRACEWASHLDRSLFNIYLADLSNEQKKKDYEKARLLSMHLFGAKEFLAEQYFR